nr:DUF3108 domain-containing protein [Pseudomonas flexibilis]
MFVTLLLFVTLLVPPAQAFELQPFSASYTADFKNAPFAGTAERSLAQLRDGSWELRFEAAMLVARLTERSRFRIEQGALVPVSYQYSRNGLGSSRTVEQDFDWSTRQILGLRKGKAYRVPLHRGLLDRSTYQLALQQDVARGKTSMTYQVLDETEVETYDFRVLGEENVRTRAGLIRALKVERVRDPGQSRRQTTLWFAPSWNYLLVRLHQRENDGKEYQIMLKSGEVNGEAVKGR